MKSEIPIYLQLRNQIVKGIGKGEFEEGELLPTVRQMAAVLRSHPVTPIRRKRGYKIRKIIKKWARTVVDLKAELEKIREQTQNIE